MVDKTNKSNTIFPDTTDRTKPNFQNTCLSYSEAEYMVLDSGDIDFERNRFHTMVDPNGSSKITIVKLLLSHCLDYTMF